jgi:NADH:ubiquinone oxidoreductase subunit 5 (subunit L)/multisubunit Na+/H+ antiporter MnhA subunit
MSIDWAWVGALAWLFPAITIVLLGVVILVGRTPSERTLSGAVVGSLVASLIASMVAAGVVWGTGDVLLLHLGPWISTRDYQFEVSFLLDRLSTAMMFVVALLTALTAHFSVRYLHREPGFSRFFLLIGLFGAGMLLLASAGGLDLLFVGWELVGLTSALLVAFFYERPNAVRAALQVFATYRLCDLGLLVAAVLLHHHTGTTQFSVAFSANWLQHPSGVLAWGPSTGIGLCLLLAAMGKSAQFPVGSWLPRAMEGPTPSSALYYGAISVHAGVFLLLRAAPLLAASGLASMAVLTIGLLTALHATLVWRTQTDVKSALAYATMTHLGLMLVEIGLGWYQVAQGHLVAHAALRGFQLLRAPSALADALAIRDANGGSPLPRPALLSKFLPAAWVRRSHALALERFFLHVLKERTLLEPVLTIGTWLDARERWWLSTMNERMATLQNRLRGKRLRAVDKR